MHYFVKKGDGFVLSNKYGSWAFQNQQKFYKFQLLCPHPSSYEYNDDGVMETICERCGKLLQLRRGNRVVTWTTPHKPVQPDKMSEPDPVDVWSGEGGFCP